jgi:hypothetical protein
MGFLDKLLGRKPKDEPQTAPAPPSMPEGDTGGTATAEEQAAPAEHSHEGEHGHEHEH